jgi:REP element-mobilizing transposase RayT
VVSTSSDKLASVHLGAYSRGYLPHFDQPGLVQTVTFRLIDSISPERLARLRQGLTPEDRRQTFNRVETEIDRGYGACYLRHPRVAEMMQETLLHFDGERYRMLCWSIMPNHVHCIFELLEGFPLPKVVKSWKSYSANQGNKLLERAGPFWAPDYFDRYVRDVEHLHAAADYIHYNPVKAGLCKTMADWPWSSYRRWNE